MQVRRSKLAGFAFKHHVRGTMSNCAALQCGSNGIEFWGNGHARFKVYDCTSRQNASCGVHVASGAGVNNVLLEKVSCTNNKGAGFEVENPNSRLRLKECECAAVVFDAVVVAVRDDTDEVSLWLPARTRLLRDVVVRDTPGCLPPALAKVAAKVTMDDSCACAGVSTT